MAVVAACGGDDVPTATTTAAPVDTTTAASAPGTTAAPTAGPVYDYEGFRALPVACGGELPPPAGQFQFAEPGDAAVDASTNPVATITTSCGEIFVELDAEMAPETVNSFAFLAGEGYFDGTVSHRVIDGFMFQAGDPTGTGGGGPGYYIADEFPPDGFVYERGVIAMANAGPGTTGSQFFIMLADSGLPPQYSAFGRVIGGEDVLDAIAAIPVGPNPTSGEMSQPTQALYLESVTIAAGS